MNGEAALEPYGWDRGWAAAFGEERLHVEVDVLPGRVVRHDGVALMVASVRGVEQLPMRLDDPVAVGDWVVVTPGLADGGLVTGLLPRRSLLRRRDVDRDVEQLLAANVDLVAIVCGLDRPVRDGRIQRSALLAADAGAAALVVLTKADVCAEVEDLLRDVTDANPGLEVVAVSTRDGRGIAELAERFSKRSVAMIGESGSGKSTLANSLIGAEVAATGAVRRGDAKGRHTTTSRELRLLPGGGTLIDSPGIRSVGVWSDADLVDSAFPEIAELAERCRFGDCAHGTEPGCAVTAAVASGELAQARLDVWHRVTAR